MPGLCVPGTSLASPGKALERSTVFIWFSRLVAVVREVITCPECTASELGEAGAEGEWTPGPSVQGARPFHSPPPRSRPELGTGGGQGQDAPQRSPGAGSLCVTSPAFSVHPDLPQRETQHSLP